MVVKRHYKQMEFLYRAVSLFAARLVALLVILYHFLQRIIRILVALICRLQRHSSQFHEYVVTSPVFLALTFYAKVLAERPWFRKCRNALYHCIAFIVGSTYEDERVAFSAPRLVKNDAYRDRLLVPEIEDLVALCEALQLTLRQRKAYFQCFLHVDFMRRSTVSSAELLRYCNLRAAPVTTFLLPNAEVATHRPSTRNRWDIMQLMAVCFSICTANVVNLVQLAVNEACRQVDESVIENNDDELTDDETEQDPKQLTLVQQMERCFAFFIGVADPMERSLLSLLSALYDKDNASSASKLTVKHLDFQQIHDITTIFDVVRLFPGRSSGFVE